MHRRNFLAGGAAVLALPAWAGINIRYLAAASTSSNDTFLLGLTATGKIVSKLALPARGHAAAAHPQRAEAVAFARRPGNFAIVLDCESGKEIARLHTPEGRHFYGHGAYSTDGAVLLTTENDYENAQGRIGLWDATNDYRRIDEISSGGVGPHEIISVAGGGFAVANGGIATHPARGRAKLNLPSMQTNLTWLDPLGHVQAQTHAPAGMRQNSIRHITAGGSGMIAAALQWQGSPARKVPLLAQITKQEIRYIDHPEMAKLRQYAGSIALSADERHIALTGPKGGTVLFFDAARGEAAGSAAYGEISGAAASGEGQFAMTSAHGLIVGGPLSQTVHPVAGDWQFDNHLVAVS